MRSTQIWDFLTENRIACSCSPCYLQHVEGTQATAVLGQCFLHLTSSLCLGRLSLCKYFSNLRTPLGTAIIAFAPEHSLLTMEGIILVCIFPVQNFLTILYQVLSPQIPKSALNRRPHPLNATAVTLLQAPEQLETALKRETLLGKAALLIISSLLTRVPPCPKISPLPYVYQGFCKDSGCQDISQAQDMLFLPLAHHLCNIQEILTCICPFRRRLCLILLPIWSLPKV